MQIIDVCYWNLARVFFGVSCFWAILGIVCNSIILITTIKTSTLRSTYNILIAICAASDVIHHIGNLFQLPLLLNFHIEMDSHICSLIMFLPAMGIATGCTCILCIGLDRMISVLFAMRYRTMNRRIYFSFLASIIFGYCAYFCFLMTFFHEPRSVMCEIVTPFLGPAYPYFTFGNFTINTLSGLVYIAIWRGLRTQTDSTVMRRIIKSLFIVVAIDLSGWFLTPGIIIVLQFLDLKPAQFFAWTYFATIFIHVALSVKFFIYYSTSSEYRSAFDSFMFSRKLSLLIPSVSKVSVISINR